MSCSKTKCLTACIIGIAVTSPESNPSSNSTTPFDFPVCNNQEARFNRSVSITALNNLDSISDNSASETLFANVSSTLESAKPSPPSLSACLQLLNALIPFLSSVLTTQSSSDCAAPSNIKISPLLAGENALGTSAPSTVVSAFFLAFLIVSKSQPFAFAGKRCATKRVA